MTYRLLARKAFYTADPKDVLGNAKPQTLEVEIGSGLSYDGTSLTASAGAHTHVESDITNLVSDLAGKAASSHTHSLSDITNDGALAALNTVGTSQIDNDAVTYAKIQNVTDARLLGRSAGSSGDCQEITVGSGLSLSGGALTNTGGGITQKVAKLTNNRVSDGSPVTTMVKATELDTQLETGTWIFDYFCVWQTSVAATAIKLGVNFSGTQTTFLVECTGFENTTAASTGANVGAHAAFGLRAGGQNRAASTSTSIFGPISADATGSNMLAIIRGIAVVTVQGNLELYFGSEATGSTQTLMAASCLRATKVA